MSENENRSQELILLLEAMCNGQLGGAETRRLMEILRENLDAQKTYFAYLDLHLGLKHIAALESDKALPADIRREQISPRSRHRHFMSAWERAVAVCGILIAIGVLAWLVRNPPEASTVRNTPTIAQVLGTVRIVDADGDTRAAEAGAVLSPGQRLETGTGESSAQLTYPDGTRLTLLNESSLSTHSAKGKHLSLNYGIVAADVSPQPDGSAMLLSTPGAKIEVLGTRFAVVANSGRTELNVSEGRVRVTRVADGQTLDVAKGQSITTNGEVRLSVKPSQEAREVWEESFEQGLPQGWTGLAVSKNLPNGSKGGVRPEQESQSEPSVFVIACRDEWVNGLFQIQKKTHLHITLKMERPNWLNVFFSTRDADATKPTWTLHNFNEIPFWKSAPGEWWTLTIPLTEFRRKRDGVFHDEPPLVGEVAYSISVSATEDDRGLAIDRIWVTPDGPGQVEWHKVP